MIDLVQVSLQMAGNAAAIHALVQPVPREQAQWQPNPQTWSLAQVMEHLYNEERGDFRPHLQEMFADPPLAWGKACPPFDPLADCSAALEGFLREREASLAWLAGLDSPDWDCTIPFPWGEIRAGSVMLSWLEHDVLHLRQLVELHHAWNEHQSPPYSLEYAGGW